LGTEGEQEAEGTVAPIVELPAGLAEEAVKRAVVFVLAELGGLDDAGKGAAAGAQDPGTAHAPKGVEAGLGKADWKADSNWTKESTSKWGIGDRLRDVQKCLSHHSTKEKEAQKMRRSPGARPRLSAASVLPTTPG
jgi:hypothetical protein